MLTSTKIAGAGLGAAAALCMISASAMAATGSISGVAVNYSTQSVTGASGLVAVPTSAGFGYVTQPDTAASTAGNITIQFNAPAGSSFTGSVTATSSDNNAGLTCASNTIVGSVGSPANTVSFIIPVLAGGALGKQCLVALNTFSLTATALQSPTATGAFEITAQLIAQTTTTFPVDTTPTAKIDLATSQSSLGFAAAGPASTLSIDVGTSGLGQKFNQGTGVDVTLGDLGKVQPINNKTFAATDGLTLFTFGSGATITVSGNFTNILSAYLAPDKTTSCATTAPSGAVNGTVTATSITFSGVTMPAGGATANQEVCVTANGTGIIGSNPQTAPPTVSIANGTASVLSATNLGAYAYNGGVTPILYSGNFAAFPMFVRIVNNTGASVTVAAVVQPDTGTAGTAKLAAVPANNNVLVALPTIVTSSGVTLDATGRASITLLSIPAVPVEQLLVNAGGVLVNLN